MIRLATVFSGIGAVEQAFKKMGIEHEIIFACDNGERELPIEKEEIIEKIKNMSNSEKINFINELYDKTKKTNYMEESYFANYKIKKENWYQDIRFLDGKKYKDKIDLFVGRKSMPKLLYNR